MPISEVTIEFECATCGPKVGIALFDVAREYERLRYSGSTESDEVEIDVSSAASIAIYCSKLCRDQGRPLVMAAMHVSLPIHRPSFGPIEVCARCLAPVDMSDWHLTILESDTNTTGLPFKPFEVEYIAVICRTCAPASTFRLKKRIF
jgi:hypothetical protein